MLTPAQAEEVASEVYELRSKESHRLRRIRDHLNGTEQLTWLPVGSPNELQALARLSRIPLLQLVVKNTSQQLEVDGYTNANDPEGRTWDVWQTNRFDRKQIRVHKDLSKYGAGYVAQWQTTTFVPKMAPFSPLQMTAAFTDDEDWPTYALLPRDDGTWWLFDSSEVYVLTKGGRRRNSRQGRAVVFDYVEQYSHGSDVTPVVRYLSDEDSDDPVVGDIEPLIPLQAQLNLTSFHLYVAQHYGAHGRRAIVSHAIKQLRNELAASGANTLMGIDADPGEVEFKEFSQTDLNGFLRSREATIDLMASLGQTSIHELTSSMANLSAAALEESRESPDRKIAQRKLIVGESHEQTLALAGSLLDPPVEFDPSARVRWKPARTRNMLAVAELVVMLHERLNIPVEPLIEHLPFDSQDLDEFSRYIRRSPDAVESLPEDSE